MIIIIITRQLTTSEQFILLTRSVCSIDAYQFSTLHSSSKVFIHHYSLEINNFVNFQPHNS